MERFKKKLLGFSFMTEEKYAILMYLVMGGITTAINIIVFILCNNVFAINYSIATVVAWIFAVLFAFISNKLYVFESKNVSANALFREIFSFVGFRLLSLLIDLFAMYVCISLLGLNALLSKVLANVIVLIVNYVFSKWFIFKK